MGSPLSPGTKLDRFEIVSQLGAGGMGEVYLAQDSQLRRSVGLKILPAEFTQSEGRLRRFEQEAFAASALNHPNIITIHEIGKTDSVHYIVTEFIDGESLRQLMQSGPVSIGKVLEVAVQITSALATAHAAGIIHRDIKPENVMLRRDGVIKVLDFGLAKLAQNETGADSEALTRALVNTDAGTVLGTASYMSPEQARGLSVDARTDIWSLGVVIYEMVAGCLPFEGSTTSDVLASILNEKEPPPLARFARDVPAELERIVEKAFRKDREQRYQTAKDMLLDLRSLKHNLEVEAVIRRKALPELPSATSTSSGQGTQATAGGAASGGVTAAKPAGPSHAASSAEYIFSGIKQHKLAAAVAVMAFILGAVGLGLYLHARYTEVKVESLAVLPFVNVGGDANTEYLSDGVTESLIDSLSQLPNVAVKSRSSVFRYKGREIDPQVAGSELGVQAVLTGRLVQRGDALSLSLELVDARNNNHLWGAQYNRRLADLVMVQEEIVKEVSDNLRVRLTGAEQKHLTRHYTDDTEAYQLYLQGRYYWNKRSAAGIRKSIEYYEQAIAKDSNYALAYAGLADSYIVPAAVLAPAEKYPKTKWAASKALELDNTLAEPHSALARAIFEYDLNFAEAEKEFQQAIKINPNYPTAHQFYALFLAALGRREEATTEAKRAQSLDPLSLSINATLGYVLLYTGSTDEAVAQFKKIDEMDLNFANSHNGLAAAYEAKGLWEEAVNEKLAEIRSTDVTLSGETSDMLEPLKAAYEASGIKGFWRKRLELLMERSKQGYVSPLIIAGLYAHLGDKDKAFEWLEKAYQGHARIVYLKAASEFDGLHSDPRYADLLKRIGLPPG